MERRNESLKLFALSSRCREFVVGEMGRNRRGQEKRSRGELREQELGGEGSAADGEIREARGGGGWSKWAKIPQMSRG